MAALADYPDDGWHRTLDIMLSGVYYCMKAEIPAMLARGGGAIVNTASGVGLVAYPHQAAYTASKHGVIGLTKVAALDYGSQGIRVNAVCPGTARTPMVDEAVRRQPSIDAHLKALHPIGRIGEAVGGGRGGRLAVRGRLVRARCGAAGRRGLRGPMRTTTTSATVRRLAAQGHLIGGRWVPSTSAGTYGHRYAATGEVQAEVGLAGAPATSTPRCVAARAAQPGVGGTGAGGAGRRAAPLADLLDEHQRPRRPSSPPSTTAPRWASCTPARTPRRGSATTRAGATSSTARCSRASRGSPTSGSSPTASWP